MGPLTYPERFSNLPEYAFPRLRSLLDVHAPGGEVMHMTIGEPKHAFPAWVSDIIAENVAGFGKYPPNDGSPELQASIASWIKRRYGVDIDPATQVLALNGTREGLFNATLALCPETKNGAQPIVLTPNPFYQVYAVAALTVGAQPHYVAATRETGFLPDYASLPAEILNRVAVAYICSPSNPQGAVASRDYWKDLFALAEKYNFRVFADECYSEIYRNDPPPGAMEVAQEVGFDPDKLMIFHSLSKRSNLPGLRSGFVAGSEPNIAKMKQLRAYAGAPLPLPLQRVAEKVWADEEHVIENRALYAEKFEMADALLGDIPNYMPPEAGFFLWLPVDDGETAALKLWQETGVRVLPGAFLAREVNGENPGAGYLRVALVAPKEETQRGLITLRDCLYR
ncbi:aminotransferase class I/II-fold pyridoxal phosphate-dependent enzyme [Actibacterium pelagium]|uniref:Aspartate aminotransferase n=1 Tax=Actibacterium pelagium TaxID=2029103 RepID=A0A917AHK9_9RHOB|nr:aminotransferase class I/II-fold pyridoxal phosphate-dependent enzyme [Actibacterium pelagium]GGE53325.1 aspartate aminotransferase [Actibacterium pelagium]